MGDALRWLASGVLYAILPTLSVAELVWLLAGAIALRSNFTGWRLRHGIWRRALRIQDRLDPRSVIIAKQRHNAEAFGLGIQIALFLLGLVAAFTPEAPPRELSVEQAVAILFFDSVLLGMQVALAIGSVRQRGYDRNLSPPPAARVKRQ